jgi:hypothetical protein
MDNLGNQQQRLSVGQMSKLNHFGQALHELIRDFHAKTDQALS